MLPRAAKWAEAAGWPQRPWGRPPTVSASTTPPLNQFFTLLDRIVAAQCDLTTSYLRIGTRTWPWSPTRSRGAAANGHPAFGNPTTSADAETNPKQRVPADSIQARAYELYERRGGQPGNEIEDWCRAEAELLAAGRATS
jgi:hypothetical protein